MSQTDVQMSKACVAITNEIIASAQDQVAKTAATPGSIVDIAYKYPDASRRYPLIAMSLRLKALAIGYIRYERSLDGIHRFTVVSFPH